MAPKTTVKVKKLVPEAVLPSYAHRGDAGADLRASTPVRIYPGETVAVLTGISIQLEEGWEAQVRSRSGLASKGIVVANSPGTIDSGYLGEVKVLLRNCSDLPYDVKAGDRIAQAVVSPAPQAQWVECDTLTSTERGVGGFGSTGQ